MNTSAIVTRILQSSKKVKLLLGLFVLLIIAGYILRFTTPGQKVPLPAFARNIIVGVSSEEKANQETQEFIKKVGSLIDLPKGEEPAVATVQDKDILVKEQKFFEGAENGDILLVYSQAAKAILYSPKRNVLVNVGPLIAPGAETAQTEEKPIEQTPANQSNVLKIEIRNGTGKSGLANIVKDSLSGNVLYEVIGVADAGNKDYQNTIIVDTGESTDQNTVNQLSKVLGAQVVQNLPEKEKGTSADVLVIVGQDKTGN